MPEGEGWFVLNARDVTWVRSEERGQDTDFEGRQEWTQLGFRIQVLAPGQHAVYHGESGQEDFLVVSGECVLVIEGEERQLKQWDFVHCPPWTKHAFVGAGDGPCAIVMVGNRVGGFEVVYAVDDVAAKYGASAIEETSKSDEAYARFGPGGALGVPGRLAAVTGVPEAQLKETDAGLMPEGEGWFVVNARDARWWRSDRLGQSAQFEGEPEFPEVGFNVHVLLPGQPNGMYHGESGQEDFLVVSGECILILEGEERPLKAWDFVHCPPMTEHIFVGAGDGPCVIVMTGRRKSGDADETRYPVNEVAAKHDASVLEATTSAKEAYARFERGELARYQEGWLP